MKVISKDNQNVSNLQTFRLFKLTQVIIRNYLGFLNLVFSRSLFIFDSSILDKKAIEIICHAKQPTISSNNKGVTSRIAKRAIEVNVNIFYQPETCWRRGVPYGFDNFKLHTWLILFRVFHSFSNLKSSKTTRCLLYIFFNPEVGEQNSWMSNLSTFGFKLLQTPELEHSISRLKLASKLVGNQPSSLQITPTSYQWSVHMGCQNAAETGSLEVSSDFLNFVLGLWHIWIYLIYIYI